MNLLSFVAYILGCYYISDLHKDPYNNRAKLLLENLDLSKWSNIEINDITEYLK